MIKSKELKNLFDVISNQKNVSTDSIKESLEEIISRVYLKKIDADAETKTVINSETGDIKLFVKKTVVENVVDEFTEVSVNSKSAKNLKLGETDFVEISLDVLPENTFIQVKQMFRQNLKEQEEKFIYEKYEPLVGTMIRAKIYRVGNGLLCNLEDATAFMQKSEFSKSDDYKVGKYMDFYILSVDRMAKDSQIKLSRSNPGLLRNIINEQIDDVKDGVIKVHDIARIAGERSKISVSTNITEIDPVGAIIGPKGSIIKKITDAVGGEKIDVIKYNPDEVMYIVESLSPAKIIGVNINKQESTNKETGEVTESRSATVIVDDNDLVQAIGKAGINVKLAVKLTGFNIDIKSASDAARDGIEYDEIKINNDYTSNDNDETYEIVEYDDLLNIMEEFDLNDDFTKESSKVESVSDDDYNLDEEEIY
ncbi:MAG: transcription termination factor NusA [Mycoplasmataceae bacterium]|nr:transcription termination factor NusA [Mycoplasmataceae bacterium]